MFKSKVVIVLLAFLFISSSMLGQSFTYSGPSTATVGFGNSTVNVTYYFTYSGTSGLTVPKLALFVDGTCVAGYLCEGASPYLPSYYNFSLTPGSHTLKFKLQSLGSGYPDCASSANLWQTNEAAVNCNSQISIENVFSGGTISVSGVTSTSPVHRTSVSGDNVSIGAIEQDNGNYHWIWNTNGTNNSEWDKIPSGSSKSYYSNSQNTSYSVTNNDANTRVVAGLRKTCNATFQNSFAGGTITVGGNSSPSPATTQVVEGNTVTATAQQFYENFNNSGLDYIFSSWEDGSTSLSKNYTINNHETHTASYTRKANTTLCFEFSFANVVVGNNIQLTWAEHPNTNVTQYKIWRRVKNGSEGYIGTVNRGTTSFTDREYQYASESDPDKETLFYNVYVYCSLDGGTWNDDGMKLVTGVEGGLLKENPVAHINTTLPKEYKLDNYPNPFNPTTVISYQLPTEGMVTLKVYDVIGKEIATLVNEHRAAGSYNVEFNASNLPSGIYIYKLDSNNFTQSRKMLLVK
jgi:hypothetical protein